MTPYLAGIAQPARTFETTATSAVIIGLTKGKHYMFTVAAKNNRGVGLSSTKSKAATPT